MYIFLKPRFQEYILISQLSNNSIYYPNLGLDNIYILLPPVSLLVSFTKYILSPSLFYQLFNWGFPPPFPPPFFLTFFFVFSYFFSFFLYIVRKIWLIVETVLHETYQDRFQEKNIKNSKKIHFFSTFFRFFEINFSTVLKKTRTFKIYVLIYVF